jgi:general secretion pathway protein F
LGLPLIGKHLRTLDATRFASTLAILVGSGVPLLAALDAGRQVIVRLPLQDAVGWVSDRVREGMPLARALGQSGQFPPLLVHMIASGEATGQLQLLLERAARLQQAELENRTAVMTTLMEPLLLLTMGGVVLLIVLAVMQPIIEINHLLR